MGGILHVHDLILVQSEPTIISQEGAQARSFLNSNQYLWVVVRRGHVTNGLIPVGVRGIRRNERCAGFTRVTEVLQTRRPDQLRIMLAEDSRRGLGAFQTLSYLESHLTGLDMSWGPGGSVGYELASGLPVVRADSDLDLILFAPQRLEITQARDLLSVISSAPGKVDALVETPYCGFSLPEFVTTSPGRILLRTSDGRVLGSDPWNLSSGENC